HRVDHPHQRHPGRPVHRPGTRGIAGLLAGGRSDPDHPVGAGAGAAHQSLFVQQWWRVAAMKPWLALVLALCVPQALAGTDPPIIVEQVSDKLFTLVDANRAAYRADPADLQREVREHLLSHVDILYSARLV